MNDDLERTLRDSLDRHAASSGGAGGGLDDVFARVDQRRSRRRSVAVVGSVAAVAVGVIGFASLAAGDPEQSVGTPDDGFVTAPPTTSQVVGFPTWSCSGYLGADPGGRDLYSDCYPITNVDATLPCMTTTMPPPTTTMLVNPGTGVVVTAPATGCATAPPAYDPACYPTTTTVPPSTTGPTIGTVPDMTVPAYVCATPSVPVTSVSYAIDTAPPTTALTTATDCRGDRATAWTTTTSPPPTTPAEQLYIVVAGDSLMLIGQRYSVAAEVIANYNGWVDCLDHAIVPGDRVLIPPGASVPSN